MAATVKPSPGRKSDKIMRDALVVALHREAADADGKPTKRLYLVADALVTKALSGDVPAIKEVWDRVEGKAPQPIVGDDDKPLTLKIIERRIVKVAE